MCFAAFVEASLATSKGLIVRRVFSRVIVRGELVPDKV
jgi:hypothetical protein